MSSDLPAVAFHDRSDFYRGSAFVLHPPQAQATLQGQGDFRLHVRQFLLDQLAGSQRATKLVAIKHVLARRVPAVFGRTQRAPGDAVSSPRRGPAPCADGARARRRGAPLPAQLGADLGARGSVSARS